MHQQKEITQHVGDFGESDDANQNSDFSFTAISRMNVVKNNSGKRNSICLESTSKNLFMQKSSSEATPINLKHSNSLNASPGSDTYVSKMTSEFCNVIGSLTEARKNFKSNISQSKTWLVQAEFLLRIVVEIEEIQVFMEAKSPKQAIYGLLADNLEHALDAFMNCDSLYLECLFYLSKSLLLCGEFKKCREHVIHCMSVARELD